MTDQLSRVFAALADPTRRDIVARLATHDATVNELAAPYDVTVQAVSKHLRVLEDAGLVVARRSGRERWNHLDVLPIKRVHDRWIGDYARGAVGLLAALDTQGG